MSTQQVLNPVILPLIRRVMPNIIAHDLIGVQPMTGPSVSIFSSKWTLDHIKMQKEHYGHFLRAYNRKKYHKISDIAALGYTMLKIDAVDAVPAKRWCIETLKPGSFVCVNTRFCFAYERDAMLFTLRWSGETV
jgi:hypothetical protein